MSDKLNTYSTAALAYLGDSTIELCVREYLVRERGFSSSAKLNREALLFVKASRQAEAMKNILDLLSEEELNVFHRGTFVQKVISTRNIIKRDTKRGPLHTEVVQFGDYSPLQILSLRPSLI